MPTYAMLLRFNAANPTQAQRLAESWAGTCGAEFGTEYAGCFAILDTDAATGSPA